ncbi:MAG: hypothetical protein ABEJ26_04205 [Halosimplex sp.]
MTRKTALTLQLLAADDGPGTATVFVTTDESPAELWARYRARAPDADPSRVGFVDATGSAAADGHAGASTDGAGLSSVDVVSSPADLTGVGMKTNAFFEQLCSRPDVERIRFVGLSLNTMAMYADEERLAKFVHAIGRRVAAVDGFGLIVVHTDGLGSLVDAALGSLVDGAVEVRAEDGALAVRTRGVGDGREWTPVDLDSPEPSADAASRGSRAGRSGGVRPPESLHAAIAAVEAERPTLTLCNYGGATDPDRATDATGAERLREYFGTLDVPVRTASLDVPAPRDVALLHRGDEFLAASPVAGLVDAVAVDKAELFESSERPAVLQALADDAHATGGVDRAFLVEVSRVAELRALRTDGGRLDAGFQYLSRLWDVPRTRRIYERLAGSGVDVHVYGIADAAGPADASITVHASDDEEIRDTWFVVHDGDGDPDRGIALVAEERQRDTYHGFWTRTPARVRALSGYVAEAHAA